MAKRILIELKSDWVLQHRSDETLPIAKLEAAFRDGFSVEKASLTTLTLSIDAEQEEPQLLERIKETFAHLYPDDSTEDVLVLTVLGAEAETPAADGAEKTSGAEQAEQAETAAQTEQDKARQEQISEQIRRSVASIDNIPQKKQSAIDDVLARVEGLVGAAEFKNLIGEIVRVAPGVVGGKNYPVFFNRTYLFSVGDGYGLSTYLGLLAETVSALGLRQMHTRPVTELRLGPETDRNDPFATVKEMLASGDENRVRVLCVDISEWMTKTENFQFKQFLRLVEKSVEQFIVVFRVPFLDTDVLADLNFSLSDLLSVKTVSFPPFSQAELQTCAERELSGYGYHMSKNAWEFFRDRITEEKGDGKFYGLNTVKKIVRELVYNKILSSAGKEKPDLTIGKRDTKALCNHPADTLSGTEELNRLVGNEEVKKKIGEIIAQIELAARENSEERPCIHMRFVGNPGTGKTTVARILGKILKEKGLLRIGKFYECAGRDFCGRYVGETAPKTASMCRDAYGSVLFIDEAYSLYRGPDNERDFGREAIDTLIAEMENHRDDFVVIMAGYTDDMERLMHANQGLASRMPYTLEFPNFTREQLYQIFVSMVNGHFKCDDRLFDAAHAYFLDLSDEVISAKEFSNARFVRNLFERTWAKAAMRCQLGGEGHGAIVLTKEDFDRASREKEFTFNIQKKSRLGF